MRKQQCRCRAGKLRCGSGSVQPKYTWAWTCPASGLCVWWPRIGKKLLRRYFISILLILQKLINDDLYSDHRLCHDHHRQRVLFYWTLKRSLQTCTTVSLSNPQNIVFQLAPTESSSEILKAGNPLNGNLTDVWDETIKALEGRVSLWIDNSCTYSVRIGQEGTDEVVPMGPGAKLAYRYAPILIFERAWSVL